jgi:hypothetical protein
MCSPWVRLIYLVLRAAGWSGRTDGRYLASRYQGCAGLLPARISQGNYNQCSLLCDLHASDWANNKPGTVNSFPCSYFEMYLLGARFLNWFTHSPAPILMHSIMQRGRRRVSLGPGWRHPRDTRED